MREAKAAALARLGYALAVLSLAIAFALTWSIH
jgi:hypothetical protein